MTRQIFPDQSALALLCQHHHILRLALFGSRSRGTERPESDVDLLVEFEAGQEPGLIGLAGIAGEFEVLLGGRRVDLRTAMDLSRHFRADVVQGAQVQYAA